MDIKATKPLRDLYVLGEADGSFYHPTFLSRDFSALVRQYGLMDRRDKRIDIRVTERERRSIASRARRAGEPVSAYVRRAALRRDADPTAAVEVDGRELASAHADLKRCGGLLNQYMGATGTLPARARVGREVPVARLAWLWRGKGQLREALLRTAARAWCCLR